MSAKPHSAAARNGSRRRRWPLVLALLLGVVVAGHAAGWWFLAGQLEAGVALWASQRRAEGWQVAHGPPMRGGWPLAVTLTLPEVALRRDGAGWQAERVRLHLLGPGFDRLRLEGEGRQALVVNGTPMPMAADQLVAVLPIGPDAQGPGGLPREAALRAERLRLDLPAGPVELGPTRLDLTTRPAPRRDESLALLQGATDRLTLPPAVAAIPGLAVLGPSLQRLSLDLALTGPWPGTAGLPAARAARWRDAGGTLEVRSLALDWGAASASASATLALDEALQPAGAGTVRLAGGTAVLQAAQAAGMLGRREATAAQFMLTMMQRTPPEGGPPRLEVPVVLEGRTLALAGLTLMRLPPWRWPGTAP